MVKKFGDYGLMVVSVILCTGNHPLGDQTRFKRQLDTILDGHIQFSLKKENW